MASDIFCMIVVQPITQRGGAIAPFALFPPTTSPLISLGTGTVGMLLGSVCLMSFFRQRDE